MQLERVRKNHMDVEWHEYTDENGKNTPVINASITEKASIIGRVGIMFLSCGTGAWRVRSSMNALAEAMGITCTTDIGLMSIEYTCFDGENGFTQSLCLTNTGVNTSKLNRLEHFIRNFETEGKNMSGEELHSYLDEIERIHGLYSPVALGLAAAIACCGFTFLLGGGLVEMFCAFVGAGLGNFFRCKLTKHHFTLFLGIVSSVSLACFAYAGLLKLGEILFGISIQHEAGYICAMLFIIPGFPFITSVIDLAKLDMRSGLERISYAILIITVATMTGWATAMLFRFQPADFQPLEIQTGTMILLRIAASFFGVYGFSLMFNSPRKMAFTAGLIGMFANTLRLELIDLAGFPVGIAAFLGAFCSGCIASVVKKKIGFPRISLTVPAIVIMVPGLYMYRGIYYMGLSNVADGSIWLTKAILIVIALPLGLVAARLCTDSNFRHCS